MSARVDSPLPADLSDVEFRVEGERLAARRVDPDERHARPSRLYADCPHFPHLPATAVVLRCPLCDEERGGAS